ncbi:MAG: TetR/AcrR family transcriptional regulator [Humibacter sp.]
MTEMRNEAPRDAEPPSARRVELLEASYQYVLTHGFTDLSLRPLAAAIGSSPRVLIFLFGSKDGLIRALLERAREEELTLLNDMQHERRPIGLAEAVERTWTWLAAPEHRALLRLWAESYTRSLVDPTGPWAGFAADTVRDWLLVLENEQPVDLRAAAAGSAERVLALAVLRGALLHLLATDDASTTSAAVTRYVSTLS